MTMVQITRIVCPVDFSEISRHAFDRALAVARSYSGTITVLHVLPLNSAVPAVPYGPEGPGPFGFDVPDRPHAFSERSRFLGIEHPGEVPVRQEVIEGGSVHKEILIQASRLSADLIVMGTHGRSGVDHLFLGSVAEKTLRTSPIPVMIVPPAASAVAEAGQPFRRILCAVDFSRDSARALSYAASLAQHSGGTLTILHVVELLPVGYDPMVGTTFDIQGFQKATVAAARKQLQEYAATVTAGSSAIETVLGQGKPYTEILRDAEERGADLIVVGVHGRGAIDRVVFGSTTEHLVRRAACPILIVRSDAGV
jgi:nucleotide-binding universal stress UspA family protein